MIGKAKDLRSLQGEKDLQNGCKDTTVCPTNTEDSTTETCTGEPCNCNTECGCQTSASSTSTENGVFKDLCDMVCCNQESGSSGCSCTDGKCQSISTFCKEVDDFIALVKEVVKQNGDSSAATSPTTPTCKCTNDKNCEYCKTCRFIRLVEVYTKELKNKHECKCKVMEVIKYLTIAIDGVNDVVNKVTSAVSTVKNWFSRLFLMAIEVPKQNQQNKTNSKR